MALQNLDKNVWKTLSKNYKTTAVKKITKKINLPIPPYLLGKPKPAYEAVLDEMVSKYSEELHGIFLGYSKKTKPSLSYGQIYDEHSTIWVYVRGVFYVFSPQVGQCLSGVIVEKTRDHLGLLMHNLFNVSLPIKGNHQGNFEIGMHVEFIVQGCELQRTIPFIIGQLKTSKLLKNETSLNNSNVSVNHEDNDVKNISDICNTSNKSEISFNTSGETENNSNFHNDEPMLSPTSKHKKQKKKKSREMAGNNHLKNSVQINENATASSEQFSEHLSFDETNFEVGEKTKNKKRKRSKDTLEISVDPVEDPLPKKKVRFSNPRQLGERIDFELNQWIKNKDM